VEEELETDRQFDSEAGGGVFFFMKKIVLKKFLTFWPIVFRPAVCGRVSAETAIVADMTGAVSVEVFAPAVSGVGELL
jgi:hypothetical protein